MPTADELTAMLRALIPDGHTTVEIEPRQPSWLAIGIVAIFVFLMFVVLATV